MSTTILLHIPCLPCLHHCLYILYFHTVYGVILSNYYKCSCITMLISLSTKLWGQNVFTKHSKPFQLEIEGVAYKNPCCAKDIERRLFQKANQ